MMYTTFEVRVPFNNFETVVANEMEQWHSEMSFPVITVTRKIKDLVERYGTTARITITTKQ